MARTARIKQVINPKHAVLHEPHLIPHTDKSFQLLIALVSILGGLLIFFLGNFIGGRRAITRDEVNQIINQKLELTNTSQNNLTAGIGRLETAINGIITELKTMTINVAELKANTSNIQNQQNNLERKLEEIKK